MPEWPTALLQLGIRDDAIAERALFDQAIHELQEAVVRRPFGDPAAMASKAASLGDALDELAERLAQRSFDQEAAESARMLLLEMGAENADLDFHSARQLAWAYLVITIELQAGYPDFAPRGTDGEGDAKGDIARWEAWRGGARKSAEQSVRIRLNELNQKLCLALPAGIARQNSAVRPDPAVLDEAAWTPVYSEYQTAYLKALASFDPAWFRSTWKNVAAADDATTKSP
jgi:hypothetical protein